MTVEVDVAAVVAEVQRLVADPPRRGKVDVYTQAIANVVGCDPGEVPPELRAAIKAFAWGAFYGVSPTTLRHYAPEVTDADVAKLREQVLRAWPGLARLRREPPPAVGRIKHHSFPVDAAPSALPRFGRDKQEDK